jgi:uncharacterized protein YeaO (DUF488 family)
MIKTRRWNDPQEPDDGFRLLICRFRPRGLRKALETWDAWNKNLGPSPELHAAFYGKHGLSPISWEAYRERYLTEMRAQSAAIKELAERVRAGETITLLCSRSCEDAQTCHRTLLKELIEAALREGETARPA